MPFSEVADPSLKCLSDQTFFVHLNGSATRIPRRMIQGTMLGLIVDIKNRDIKIMKFT